MKILKYLLFLMPVYAIAQVHNVDSLRKVAAGSKSDAAKINALRILSDYYIVSNTDSGVKYAELLRTVSIKANNKADEYMRLSYHGLRAKDKTFNSAMETHLDSDLPNVNVVPQDIGRVLLNLFNNAFYAVHQKKKQHSEGYLPQVTLTTLKKDGFIEISLKDNGNGISDNIRDKIMQPFFTTKPTGEGTGLGLSLSYDIIVKGHGGSIDVNSNEGEGSEFIIKLPSK